MNSASELVKLKDIAEPKQDGTKIPVMLSDKTMQKRKQEVLNRMHQRNLDALLIYADMEHGSNFEYLVGFLPRFEEALLILHADGCAQLILGNENLSKSAHSRIEAKSMLYSPFSLPDQPDFSQTTLPAILVKADLANQKTGIVGWKKFKGDHPTYEIPAYILEAAKEVCGKDNLCSATDIFIGPNGARLVNNPNEIAHYEFASALAGDCMLDAINALHPGITEMEGADKLDRYGQHHSIVTISAFGERFEKGNLYPTQKQLHIGDAISMTVGYRGGCSSRAFMAVRTRSQLPPSQQDYFEKLCAPYFSAIALWLTKIHTGMQGGELYALMEQALPQDVYHWRLCPGHTTAEEEWMSSPIYRGSQEPLLSGMLIQTDIIPSLPGYAGTSVESTCCLADDLLQKQIAEEYPEMYSRMMERRAYIINQQGISLSKDILPMCSTMTYLRPYAFSHKACVIEKSTNSNN